MWKYLEHFSPQEIRDVSLIPFWTSRGGSAATNSRCCWLLWHSIRKWAGQSQRCSRKSAFPDPGLERTGNHPRQRAQKQRILFYSTYRLKSLIPEDHYKFWQLVAWVKISRTILFSGDIQYIDVSLIPFCTRVDNIFGHKNITFRLGSGNRGYSFIHNTAWKV